jgi:3-oxoacyl-[acyl-carrier-protein] synthase-3
MTGNRTNLINVKISAVSHFLPKNIKTNQDIIDEHSLRLKDEWIKGSIGIESRHWCEDGESASDLAAEVLKDMSQKTSRKTDGLILSTVSEDLMTPSTATIVQSMVHPGETYPAFDITAACSGFVYAIDLGKRMVQTGHDQVACVASEIRSYYLNKKDRRTVMLFGDGAGGVMLSPCEEGEVGIIYSKLVADGRHWNSIVVTGNGSRKVKEEEAMPHIEMRDATHIFETAVSEMQGLVLNSLKDANLTLSDIDYFIFHQASRNIVKNVADALNLSEDKYYRNFHNKGNMTSASTAVALSEASEEGKIKKGDKVLILATGGGFTGGVVILRWEI